MNHVAPADALGSIARSVVAAVRPNRADRLGADDCYQAAYLAGMLEVAAARRLGTHTSTKILRKAMTRAVYRQLERSATVARRREIREADVACVC